MRHDTEECFFMLLVCPARCKKDKFKTEIDLKTHLENECQFLKDH